jgi:hypothetical protein
MFKAYINTLAPIPVLVLGAVFFAGCPKPTTKIGAACEADGDCNVPGQICVAGLKGGPKICTRPCTSNVGDQGCPYGYDCTVAEQARGLTCNATLYHWDLDGGVPLLFGKSCAADANACQNTGDPNAMPMCRVGADTSKRPPVALMLDPKAYCTGTCADDLDCPLDMYCGDDWDTVKKCLKRTVCSPCDRNEHCSGEFDVCLKGTDGKGYCTKSCGGDEGCPGAGQFFRWMSCQDVTDIEGGAKKLCVHRYGTCVGDGEVCAPCRTRGDCKMGLSCLVNSSSLEGFCTRQCSDDTQCASPHAAGCDLLQGGPNDPPPSQICVGDPVGGRAKVTCWPN